MEKFELWITTFESTLEKDNDIKKVKEFRTYITVNWNRIFDWRDQVSDTPSDARGLGAMESNQRRITFRMKKRGMHWSKKECEAMVKVKQGIFNGTLRVAYIGHIRRTTRQLREDKKIIRLSKILNQKPRPSIGAKQGSIALYAPSSSANYLKRFVIKPSIRFDSDFWNLSECDGPASGVNRTVVGNMVIK